MTCAGLFGKFPRILLLTYRVNNKSITLNVNKNYCLWSLSAVVPLSARQSSSVLPRLHFVNDPRRSSSSSTFAATNLEQDYRQQGPKKQEPRMARQIKFTGSLEKSDPLKNSVVIVGQLEYLKKLSFEQVRTKLEPRVSSEIFELAVSSLQPSPIDSVPLYVNRATLTALPSKVSRHNTPSRSHTLSKIVKSFTNSGDEYIVIVCDKAHVLASATAVARAIPLFNRKSEKPSKKNNEQGNSTTTVEFLLASKCPETGDITVGEEKLTESELTCLDTAARAVRNAARLTDTPCSEMHTNRLINEAKIVAEELGVKITVIQGEELNERGMGGIYNVGKAAENEPALVVLSHTPNGANKTICWVGKGIVYDTGGLSIKSKTGMCHMKRDMGGAAGILNAFYVAVKEGFQQNLHAVLCLAENAVGPKSYRPDDIIQLYSKKTVEINNTDAEGRLVLADGVVYAKNDLNADIIIDMATLTGGQGVATGNYHAAVLTNSEEWESAICAAGKSSGDLTFPLVFSPELHFSEFNSVVADMRNSVADRTNALSSCAGLFIMAHLGFDFPGVWVHIDMASPVESGDRATGYGVALLNTLFGSWSSSLTGFVAGLDIK